MNYTFRSPGRINLIGEYTDFNGGYVLPAAIDRYTYITFQESDHFEVYTKDLDKKVEFDLDDKRMKETWANYVKGSIFHLTKYVKKQIRPFKIEISSTLPMGAGLSSSASLMVGMIYSISKIEKLDLDRERIAQIAHEAENEFVGVNCGIMDQYAVSLSKKDSFILIDASDGHYEYISAVGFPKITVVDSGVKHELASGGYNTRRNECARAIEITGMQFRQMDLEVIESKRKLLGEDVYKRAKHVIEEDERVLKAIKAIEAQNWRKVGEIVKKSHESLRDLFEVSTDEMDFLVDRINALNGVYGSRMIGGGFGGSIIVLSYFRIDEDLKKISEDYGKQFGFKMKFYPVKLSSGVRKVN
uniref:Galactokinase n=1 Tax=Mesoaciditoga lauensis TaxID=1495039 RepID=A0A7V3VS31_9BACT